MSYIYMIKHKKMCLLRSIFHILSIYLQFLNSPSKMETSILFILLNNRVIFFTSSIVPHYFPQFSSANKRILSLNMHYFLFSTMFSF